MTGTRTIKSNAQVVNAAKAQEGFARDGKSSGLVTTEYKISGEKGLSLVVQPSGTGTYFVRYQIGSGANRKQQRIKIGDRDLVTLHDAKAKALELMSAVAKGADPVFEKASQYTNVSLADLLQHFDELDDKRAPRTKKDYVDALKLDILPTVGVLRADEVSKAQLAALLARVKKDSDWAADKACKGLMAVYKFGRAKGIVNTNPAAELDFRYSGKPRTRVATDAELAALWTTIDSGGNVGPAMRAVLKLAILTGQRIGNIVEARTSELRLTPHNPIWRIAASDMKVNAREQVVPLSEQAAEIFAEAVRGARDGWVFPVDMAKVEVGETPRFPHLARDSATTAMSRACERVGLRGAIVTDRDGEPLRQTLTAKSKDGKTRVVTTRHGDEIKRIVREKTDVTPLTLHDMRTAVTTWLRETRHERGDVCDAILHHSKRGTTGKHYDMSTLEGPVRIALQAWADHVTTITGGGGSKVAEGDAGNVVELAARRTA